MNSISSTQVRQHWAATVEQAREEPIVVTEHGRETVVVMDAQLAKLALQVLEDSRDLELAISRVHRVDDGEATLTQDEVAAQLAARRG
jgi:prevent-host-death family protein